ncbi:MAG: carboxypeptidase M32 [Phycisphaeraceae bacterium]|nr:MAG: carboxypeptidase M32 [Phycisphaeraceae bacterium]
MPTTATAAKNAKGAGKAAAYTELLARLRAGATLGAAGSVLSWDQETRMPPKAAEHRAEQLSMIARLVHERMTDPALGELIEKCEADASLTGDPVESANLREIRRDYDRARKLPTELVSEMSETNSRAMEAWKAARKKSDFSMFLPWLEKQVALNLRKAECYGAPAGGELYDALMEDYEPGMTAKQVDAVFTPLRAALAPMIEQVAGARKKPDNAVNTVKAPLDRQIEFNKLIAARVGYDFDAGELAVSTHPFSSSIGIGDVRMTTRYAEDHIPEAVSTTLHESGHSLYEQGLPREERFGQPLAEAVSLGIHESQSRLWENQVGRSPEFWTWALPEANRIFDGAFKKFTPDDVSAAMNAVKPWFIRVESDEATYNLHIMLRFDFERALIRGDMKPKDLPGAWNERMKKDLGLDVPDDARGCLQDVHWSMGSIGYFPTYTLGTLYAAQMWETIRKAIPDLDQRQAKGDFAPLLAWLRENVHAHGRRFTAPELCERLTGNPLSHKPFMSYMEAKLAPIYGL